MCAGGVGAIGGVGEMWEGYVGRNFRGLGQKRIEAISVQFRTVPYTFRTVRNSGRVYGTWPGRCTELGHPGTEAGPGYGTRPARYGSRAGVRNSGTPVRKPGRCTELGLPGTGLGQPGTEAGLPGTGLGLPGMGTRTARYVTRATRYKTRTA